MTVKKETSEILQCIIIHSLKLFTHCRYCRKYLNRVLHWNQGNKWLLTRGASDLVSGWIILLDSEKLHKSAKMYQLMNQKRHKSNWLMVSFVVHSLNHHKPIASTFNWRSQYAGWCEYALAPIHFKIICYRPFQRSHWAIVMTDVVQMLFGIRCFLVVV